MSFTSQAVESIDVGGPAPYVVRVGNGIAGQVVAAAGRAQRVGLIHGPQPQQQMVQITEALESAGYELTPISVPDGEAGKSLDVARECWDALGRNGFTRSDVIVGFGGGSVTDLAGFVAATWLRGVGLINLPTTLLGMVDAAVGGKTAINVAAGKNLVGAFHPPLAVLVDLDFLDTLPEAEYRSGLAEVVKCGFIADPVILDLLAAEPAGRTCQAELVVRAVRVKADVVAEDLTDLGRREMLNYGHTLGHAIESASSYSIRHGEAISIGMVFAAQLARHAGLLDRESALAHRELLAAMRLPTTYQGASFADLLGLMRVDKKARGDRLRFVVLEGIGRPRILDGPDDQLLAAAYSDLMPA